MKKLWIARDANGADYLYTTKPIKDIGNGIWKPNNKGWSIILEIYNVLTMIGREISWEDEEPICIEVREVEG